jgi:hypothetical protein
MTLRKILFSLLIFNALMTCSAYAESNESEQVLQESKAKVQAKLEEFSRTNNYELLLDARKLASSMNPRGIDKTLSKLDEGSLRLQLKVLMAIIQARDSNYDYEAPENIVYMNVGLPENVPGIAGMDPEAIKDLNARKKYEEAIEQNNRRNEKLKRELYLSRGVDYAVIDVWYFIRNLPNDSAAKRSALDIIETSVTDKTVLNRLNSKESPGLTR